MRPRKSVFVFTAVVLTASVLLVAPAAGTGYEPPPCDPEYVQIHANRVTVLPTGVDDTANLQCALDYAVTRPWTKVMLVEGDYYTSFLEAEGFHGVFKGKGRHRTNLITLPDGLDCITRLEEAGDVALLTFVASDVIVKRLAFGIGGDAACAEPWNSWVEFDGSEVFDWSISPLFATTRLRPAETCLEANVEHQLQVYGVGMESEFPAWGEPVVNKTGLLTGVAVGRTLADDSSCPMDRLHGTVIVRGSHFTGIEYAVVVGMTHESMVYVGGPRPWHANVMDDVGVGVFSGGHNGSRIVVKGNDITARWWGSLAVGDDLGGAISKFVFTRNTVEGIDTADGVGALDFGLEIDGVPRIKPLIGWNKIDMFDTGYNGVVVIGADGKILGNKITGTALSGIMVDGIGFFDEEAGSS